MGAAFLSWFSLVCGTERGFVAVGGRVGGKKGCDGMACCGPMGFAFPV